MKENKYDFIDYEEDKHWWFVARSNILKSIIESYDDDIENFLDIGCGTGNFLTKVAPICQNLYGLDPHKYHNQKIENICQGTVESIPFDNNMFDFISCFDLLEHVKNPKEALDGIMRVLKPGGFAIITVPACQSIYGPHDRDLEHYRRFSKASFEAMVDKRFEIMKSTYFNSLLFPVEYPIRLLERLINKQITKDSAPKPFMNKMLFKIFNSEKGWLLNHSYPIGISYLIVLRKRR